MATLLFSTSYTLTSSSMTPMSVRSVCACHKLMSTHALGCACSAELKISTQLIREGFFSAIVYSKYRERRISPKFSCIKFFCDPLASWTSAPLGQGRPRKKTLFSCAPSDGVRVFGSGRPPGYLPGRPRDIPPKKFMFGLLFPFLKILRIRRV